MPEILSKGINMIKTNPRQQHPEHVEDALRALPKISLHDHLDGGLRPQTIMDLAEEIGLETPCSDARELAKWIAGQSNSGSLSDYLKPFSYTVAVIQTEASLARVAREFVQDLAADGVIYGEIRWAPENHIRDGLSLDQAVDAVKRGLEDGVADVAAVGKTIKVGQILAAMRHDAHSMEIAKLAVRHRDHGVCGFDIAGAESGFPPSKHSEAFAYLASNFFPVTVHAGEGAGLESIRSAILDARALRLGHGVRLAEDILRYTDKGGIHTVLGAMGRWIRDRRITLEISPSSNVQTGAILRWGDTVEDHPFDLLYKLGLQVTVNVDNRLMSDTTLSRELSLLMKTFGYSLADLQTFQLNAADAAFLPFQAREELKSAIRKGFAAATALNAATAAHPRPE